MAKKKTTEQVIEKILDVDASMQGSITFRDPVNLRINGSFEGKLDTKGKLTVGQNAVVRANIDGDAILVEGKILGNITATVAIEIDTTGVVEGDIVTPNLSMKPGALVNGRIVMGAKFFESEKLTVSDLARYLEVETSVIQSWLSEKKIPAQMENNEPLFDKKQIDQWIQQEKIATA